MRLPFYFDFSCPYAYLASTRVEGMAARAGVQLELRPILLGGVFAALATPQNLAASKPAAKIRHDLDDLNRHARLIDVPLEFPAGHPNRTVTALRALLAVGEPFGPLAHRFFAACWAEGRDLSRDSVVEAVLAEAGHDPAEVLARAGSPAIKAELRRRTDQALADGVFGVPAFVLDGELFWGQDRLGEIERALGVAPTEPPPPASSPCDFWFDFSSPFAYLASTRVEAALGTAVRFRPMLLGAVFAAVGTPNVPLHEANAPKRAWLEADMRRQAAQAGVALRWPSRFPLRTLLPLRAACVLGPDSGAGRAFVHAVFAACWQEDRDPDDPAVIGAIARSLGLDAPALLAAASRPEAKAALRECTGGALEAGVFGAPTFVVHCEPPALYWGNDRLGLARLAASGDERAR